MKPETYLRLDAPMDWQDRLVLLACVFAGIALAIIFTLE